MWPVTSMFKEELKKSVHTVAVKVEFLDTNFTALKTITAYTGVDPNDALIDGTVDVDITRGTRRTLTMSLLNLEGAFTADASVWSESTDWDGYFYINRLIRVYRGVRYESGEEEFCPIGTFMVDKSETLVERDMSTVVIAGSDLWKKFTKSQFGVPTTYADGTAINTVIADLCADAGVTRVSIDPLIDRVTAAKTLQTDFILEEDETRGDALLKLCTDHGIEVFFDPMGVLTTREFSDPMTRPIEWTFGEGDDMAFFMRAVIDDDRLYNHVIVVGTANASDGGTIYKAELKDQSPSSPTSITRIGDRVFRYSSPLLGSQEAVDRSARTIFYKHFQISQSVALESICNPAFEGNDVVKIVEDHYTKLNTRYLLSTFSVPLVTSKQRLGMKRVVDVTPS